MGKLTTEEWERSAIDSARTNHLWLNAFNCVRPTDDFKRQVGDEVLRMLNTPENLIPSEHQLTGNERVLVLRINKS